MRILYVGNFQQQHCTEVHLASTLESLGNSVIRVQENGGDEYWLDNELASNTFDLFLFTRTWGNTVKLRHLESLRARNIPSASYHLDLYVGLKRQDGLDNDPFWRTDYVFTPDGDPASQAVFESKGINHYYMKPGIYKPECYITERDSNGIGNKVIFVGGGSPTEQGEQYGHTEWPYRGQLLKFLQDTYGEDYTKYGWPQETIRNDSLNRLYANSDVVVGDSLCLNFDHPYYWSDRVYETLGRGGFLIHPYIKGMDEEFTDGVHLAFYDYNNWEQLKEKIDYYLEHTEEREQIRRQGHEFVKNHATYRERLQQMLQIVGADAKDYNGYNEKAEVKPQLESIKISLGAGLEPEMEPGWINVDLIELPNIQVVHNLMEFPYPFEDNSASYIKAKDIVEHLDHYIYKVEYAPEHADLPSHEVYRLKAGKPAIIAFVEECHRILEPGGMLWIQTPGWDAEFMWIDPTHVRGFDIRSFDFFDPDTDFGRGTGFYSTANFRVTATQLENKNLQFTMVKL